MNKVMVYACRLLMIWAFIPFGMNAQTAKYTPVQFCQTLELTKPVRDTILSVTKCV